MTFWPAGDFIINLISKYTRGRGVSFLPRNCEQNTQGTRGWSRLRDRTLAVQKNRAKIIFIVKINKNYISSIYGKILGETNFHARGFPEVGEK